MTPLHLSREQARRFLAAYHFTPTDGPGVFARLGTVQYDPLNPLGRNPDLVLQARIPGYQVDDWQRLAYQDRLIFDGWDKQACLIPISDWPQRAITREMYRPYHDREILKLDPETPRKILEAIDAQGPLSSREFEDRQRVADPGSWSGSTQTSRALRAMWVSGILVTHHRQAGRHYYDRPERTIPLEYQQPLQLDREQYHRWILGRRFQATGLLRSNAEAAIWSACGDAPSRKQALKELIEMGKLMPVLLGEKALPFYMPSSALPWLEAPQPEPRVIFLGPLDSLLWDRKALLQIFDFDYIWEVYKPAAQRRWGYYVLPVFYRDRFIARVDSHLEKGCWRIDKWWWEAGVVPDEAMLDALRTAASAFLHYLRASELLVSPEIEPAARTALLGAHVPLSASSSGSFSNY